MVAPLLNFGRFFTEPAGVVWTPAETPYGRTTVFPSDVQLIAWAIAGGPHPLGTPEQGAIRTAALYIGRKPEFGEGDPCIDETLIARFAQILRTSVNADIGTVGAPFRKMYAQGFVGSGIQLTALNAAALAGEVPVGTLPASVTLQGNTFNAANLLLQLDGGGLIPGSLLPALALSETFVVVSQAAMLALTAQRGDVAIRTDTNTTYILATDDPTTLGDWKQLLTPASSLFSDLISSTNTTAAMLVGAGASLGTVSTGVINPVMSAAHSLSYIGRSRIESPSDGTIYLKRDAATTFARLGFGSAVGSPSIKAVGGDFSFVSNDDATPAGITCGAGNFVGALSTSGGGGFIGNASYWFLNSSANGEVNLVDNTQAAYATLRLAGLRSALVAKTANYTATLMDGTITTDATGGSLTITLPTAASSTGLTLRIKRLATDVSANTVTIDPNGAELVDGNATQLVVAGVSYDVQSNGTGWVIV